MITNHSTLIAARQAWIAAGGDQFHFDAAATVLDSATCRADIRIGLANPPYSLAYTGGSDWHIGLSGSTMIKFQLTEHLTAQTADVDILP